MRLTFAVYEHTTIGFPHVKLKWTVEEGKWAPGYVTEHGIIKGPWTWEFNQEHPCAEREMKRFDDWVRLSYKNDISVQG